MSTRLRPTSVLWLVAACALILAGCNGGDGAGDSIDPTTVPETPTPAEQAFAWPSAAWEVSTPEAEGMDGARLDELTGYCEEYGCNAVVVTRHGRVVWEYYGEGFDENSTDIGYSMAKSFTSALVGIAIAEGHIEGIDQSAADFIEEWQGTEKERIALRHVLTLTSGLEWHEAYEGDNDVTRMYTADDSVGYVLDRPLAAEPGTQFHYSTGDPEVFSRILRVATGLEANDYAQEKIFEVLGMPALTWPEDRMGQTMTYCCVTTTAREFAKFGYLYLRNGRWEDEQVVPEEWVRESTQPSQDMFPQYGYLWWLPDLPDAPPDTFEARGIQAKHLYVIPSLDIVAVRLGIRDAGQNDNAFLKALTEAVID